MFANRLRGTLLIGSTLALLAGSGASAQIRDQVVDDPPGTQFQTQGNRLGEARSATPSVWSRSAHGHRAYAYAPRHIVVRHHRVVRHYHYYD